MESKQEDWDICLHAGPIGHLHRGKFPSATLQWKPQDLTLGGEDLDFQGLKPFPQDGGCWLDRLCSGL